VGQITGRAENSLILGPVSVLLYAFYILCGVAILYSLMIALSATSIWLGQNRSLYDFWFYITNFSRYPMEIYEGTWGGPLRFVCTFVIPVLVVVNVPARIIARPVSPTGETVWPLALFALVATAGSLLASRLVFQAALRNYRSASS
jgi:ABC-2 type transport system permease protein